MIISFELIDTSNKNFASNGNASTLVVSEHPSLKRVGFPLPVLDYFLLALLRKVDLLVLGVDLLIQPWGDSLLMEVKVCFNPEISFSKE